MPKSIYPSVDEMTNLKTRDRKRKSKTLKSDKEKLEAIKEILRTLDLDFGKIQNIDYDKTRMERTIEKEVYNDIQKIKAILGIPV